MEVLPVGTASSPSVANPRVSTVYFYVGLDCGDADARCSAIDGENDGLAVIDPGLEPRRSLLIRGTHPQLGGFELEARAVSAGSTPGARAEGDVKVSFVGKAGVPVVDVRRYVEGLHTAHRRVRRKGGQAEEASVARKPFVLPDEVDAGSDVVLVQVGEKLFSTPLGLLWSCCALVCVCVCAGWKAFVRNVETKIKRFLSPPRGQPRRILSRFCFSFSSNKKGVSKRKVLANGIDQGLLVGKRRSRRTPRFP